MEKWRVEFASSADCHPVKLACQLTANNLLDASSAGRSIADNESRNMCSPITNLQFLFCFLFVFSKNYLGIFLFSRRRSGRRAALRCRALSLQNSQAAQLNLKKEGK